MFKSRQNKAQVPINLSLPSDLSQWDETLVAVCHLALPSLSVSLQQPLSPVMITQMETDEVCG